MSTSSSWKALHSRRILVTGGCGFIGSTLVRHLIENEAARILCLDKLTYAGDPERLAVVIDDPRYGFHQSDICDRSNFVSQLSEFAPDVVIHLAAENHVDRSIDAPDAFVRTNVMGTFNVLDASLHYWRNLPESRKNSFRVLNVSTDEVYGTLALGNSRFTEQSPYAPNSPYAATKAAADHLARAWHRTYGLPVIISNSCNNYGPFQFPDKLIPTMIISAIEGRPLPVYGTGANVRDWLHVDDHVQALLAIATNGAPGTTYPVGADSEMSNIDLVTMICRTLDDLLPASPQRPHERLISFVTDRPGHDLRYAVDSQRLRRELGWMPRKEFSSGLRQTIEWYLNNSAWWQRIRRNRYDGRRLGLQF